MHKTAILMIVLSLIGWGERLLATEIPTSAHILVVGGDDAAAMTRSTGAYGLLARALKKMEPRRSWKFSMLRAGGDNIADIDKALAAGMKKKPDAVILQVGQSDAWDVKAKQPGLALADYKAGLENLIATAKGIGVPISMGTPLLIGENVAAGNAVDARLDAVAEINKELAQTHALPIADHRATLKGWLLKNNEKKRKSGVLTSNGTKLRKEGSELLLPGLAQSLGIDDFASVGSQKKVASSAGQRPENGSTLMIVGDKSAMKGIQQGGRDAGWFKTLRRMQAEQWTDHRLNLYPRHGRNGGGQFATAQLLSQHVATQVVAIQPATVVLLYGYLSTDAFAGSKAVSGITPQSELAGLQESVAQLRQAGCRVILVPPIGGGDKLREDRGREAEKILAGIAQATGAELSSARSRFQTITTAKDGHDAIVYGIATAIGLKP